MKPGTSILGCILAGALIALLLFGFLSVGFWIAVGSLDAGVRIGGAVSWIMWPLFTLGVIASCVEDGR